MPRFSNTFESKICDLFPKSWGLLPNVQLLKDMFGLSLAQGTYHYWTCFYLFQATFQQMDENYPKR